MSKILFIDLKRCIYCRSCEVACEKWHNGHSHMSVVLINNKRSVPMNCRHCTKNPCLFACPTKAISRHEDGPVIINTMKCIGCKLCAIVCPFGILDFDISSRVMRKCDLCIERLNVGKKPACVITCPAKALSYDDFDVIMRRVREHSAASLIKSINNEHAVVIANSSSLKEFLAGQ